MKLLLSVIGLALATASETPGAHRGVTAFLNGAAVQLVGQGRRRLPGKTVPDRCRGRLHSDASSACLLRQTGTCRLCRACRAVVSSARP